MRDHNREWILGYNHYLGECSVFEAELWGIFDGLLLIHGRDIDKVIIFIDSLVVVKAIQDGQLSDLNFVLVRRIFQVLKHIGHWRLRYVSREENKAADFLAKMASDKKEGVQIFDEVPKELIVSSQSLI
ncbi:hypothetical protein Golob_002274 [Gossypium lobatum]|uniref:RNase H type-1 domain-containing protein n=1 Tax=Gossypium lobatum TaxID=34289 RepID=A0A7J8N4S3_9ROSI|nr:hypothetical protein [Gossypium lobatum]